MRLAFPQTPLHCNNSDAPPLTYQEINRCQRDLITAPISVSSQVSQAVTLGKPVVALESAFLSHGMPAPENFNTAVGIQGIISELGTVPAITAVIDGTLRVSLSVP